MSGVFYKKFDNGLRLVGKTTDGVRSLSAGVWVGAGSAFESAAENGLSHYIEHMLFKGTKKRSAFDIADAVDRLGAQINATTAKECTCFYTKSVDEHAEACFEILGDLFFNSVFDPAEAEKEKSVIAEEINMVEDTPDEVCHELLAEAVFGKHNLGRRILGSEANVRAFTRDDVTRYMAARYTPANTVIAVAGNIKAADAESLARMYFADKFTASGAASPAAAPPVFKSRFLKRVKKIEQANLAVGFPSIAFNSERTYPLMLFNNVYGASMSARLFQKIREELGLAYSIYSYLSSYKNCGMFSVFCGAGAANAEKAARAIRCETERLIKDGLSEDEFLRGKEQLKGGFILGQENPSSIMNAMGKTMLISGEVFDLDEKIARIRSVTRDEVREAYIETLDFSRVSAAAVSPRTVDLSAILS